MLTASTLTDATLYGSPQTLIMLAALGGFAMLLFAAYGLIQTRDHSAARMRSLSAAMNEGKSTLTKGKESAPRGLKKALIPEDPSERAQIRFQLAKVGFERADSVEIFFFVRLCLALAPPVAVFAAIFLAQAGLLPPFLADKIEATSKLRLLQIAAIGAGVGFYGPGMWLYSRIKARKDKISKAFPNALDLVQISVEAGLGFDAAINRVGNELGGVAPEIAYEFLLLQLEIQAGRDRESALFDMAERMGIDEARSFALVIVQSLQFGTSLTSALKTYAAEMREMRELAAQEKANKLPVQMSGVMSMLMLPALFLITLTPIIIRYNAIY